jgi:hypothetical protein
MSFGFGLGLPHYVAVLGGGSPPATVYFLSLTSYSTDNLTPYSISVDSFDVVTVFGSDAVLGGLVNGLGFKLTSSGALALADKFINSTNGGPGVQDSSGNYYYEATDYVFCCCSTYTYPEIIKLDSGLNKIGGAALFSIGNGGASGTPAKPYIDSAGNIWFLVYDDSSATNLPLKIDSALTTATTYYNNVSNILYTTAQSFAISPSNQLIYAGAYQDASCGPTASYALIYSVSSSAPTGAPTWYLYDAVATIGEFRAVSVDSSNNTYTSLYYYNAPATSWLGKISSAGVLQWQRNYTGFGAIQNTATDSSGNVYAVALSGTGLAIIKVNSTGTLQYSRTLSSAAGNINLPKIVVSGSIIYVTALYTPSGGVQKTLVFKIPADGTLTQTISVGGYSFTYAAGSVTSATATVTLASVGLSVPLTAVSRTISASTVTPATLAASNAVTTL